MQRCTTTVGVVPRCTAVYNLTYGVDVQQTEARISDYERANRANIIANQARKVRQWGLLPPASHRQPGQEGAL